MPSVEIMSVENVSWNTKNEWNEVNCTKELKGKDQKFCPSTWSGKVKKWGCNDKRGMTMNGETCMMGSIKMEMDEKKWLKVMDEMNDSGS